MVIIGTIIIVITIKSEKEKKLETGDKQKKQKADGRTL